ncbi:hypothetical protein A9Q91_00265 [Candidatus Gracilibacteria bacterium 28_42_T64]|nr:hypothetical protein A9Q91_00265 [Candidatus Gracilibacteria bacterium 28_42_T64]
MKKRIKIIFIGLFIIAFIGLLYLMFSLDNSEENIDIIKPVDLSKGTFIPNLPQPNEETRIKFIYDGDLSGVIWGVKEQPKDSSIVLKVSEDKKNISFVPKKQGRYILEARDQESNSKREFSIAVYKSLLIDKNKVNNNGIVQNQRWIESSALLEDEIITLLESNAYSELNYIGYKKDIFGGFLIEFDETNPEAFKQIELLKLDQNIDDVKSRRDWNYFKYSIN